MWLRQQSFQFFRLLYGEKPDPPESPHWGDIGGGKRIFIGLYRPRNLASISDANGAANILRKVAATLGLCLKGVSSGALTTPVRVHYWATCEFPSMQERGESKNLLVIKLLIVHCLLSGLTPTSLETGFLVRIK